jgi:uncharacterized protein with ATP-grasp and redox domains
MRASPECRDCLQRLAHQAADLATGHESVKAEAIEKGLEVIRDHFSFKAVTIVIAAKIHDVVKEVTGNPDPYREMKDREIAMSRELFHEAAQNHGDGFKGLLKLAALGNAIDFFRPFDAAKADMRKQVEFAIDDSEKLEARLKDAKKVLYLADNAGEVFFDLPLLKYLRKFARVIYVVKVAPVQNDITLKDVRRAGVEAEVGEMMTTGTATPGIDFAVASEEFKREFAAADLVFAKGMGYWETLSELPAEGRVFYCLKAKCVPVAASLGVSLDSYVAMLR